jgi:hypothetical protein
MKASILNRSKLKSLTAQIRDAERQVLIRQRCVDVRAATLVRTIHQQMIAPATLLLAGGFGFIIGELTKRQVCNSPDTAGKPRVAETSPLRTALNLMTSVHTLYTALPIAWMIKSFHQPGASGQAPERQIHPATNDIR